MNKKEKFIYREITHNDGLVKKKYTLEDSYNEKFPNDNDFHNYISSLIISHHIKKVYVDDYTFSVTKNKVDNNSILGYLPDYGQVIFSDIMNL